MNKSFFDEIPSFTQPMNEISNFFCSGWSVGPSGRCDVDVDECASNPCVNGRCNNLEGRFTCECEPGYHGHRSVGLAVIQSVHRALSQSDWQSVNQSVRQSVG